ncbi:MAG: glycosyltransferase family 2 protein [Bacteroidales bacterium]|jgi:GT2 family glycosyltransferase|nr:glycosyltransferase family 2 protein [Bacteroidales bacterium]
MLEPYLLSIVIVTYKSDVYIDDCIKSIYEYNDLGIKLKIIVIDNSPIDYLPIKNICTKYESVLYLGNPQNNGFGAANNIGAAIVYSKYILFLNNDVELIEPVFKSIIKDFEENASLGCVGIRQTGGGMSFFARYEIPGGAKNIKVKNKLGKFDDSKHFLSGAFMFFRREAFIKSGKFDEKFFMYFEEPDILKRLQNCGYFTRYRHDLKFLHKIGNRRYLNEMYSKIACESLIYYIKKNQCDNWKIIFSNWLWHYRKLRFYFFIKFDYSEIFKINRIIKYDKSLFMKFRNEKGY